MWYARIPDELQFHAQLFSSMRDAPASPDTLSLAVDVNSQRSFCRAKGITYQSFWTLTGNKNIVQGRAVTAIAKAHGCTPEQAWLGFVRALGITPLTGTTSAEHMANDLRLPRLSEAEVERLERLIA